ADIHHFPNPGAPYEPTVVGGTLFFCTGGPSDYQLWKTDGTGDGTVIVKDFSPGTSPFDLTNVNGTLFFGANDGTHGNELWKSDGTTAGTVMVKDIFPGSHGSFAKFETGSLIRIGMTNVNGTLFFVADGGSGYLNYELWKSDGTAAGTVLVKD